MVKPVSNIIFERSDNGAGGGTRTRTRFEAERILSPSRLPFRHPGIGLIVSFLIDRFNCFYKEILLIGTNKCLKRANQNYFG